MIRSRVLLRALMMLVAIAVAAMPASGAHLHLCLDGGEAPASIHLAEDGPHHSESGTDAAPDTHNDKDLQLAAPAIAKKADGASDSPTVMAVGFVLFFRMPVSEPTLLSRASDDIVVVPSVHPILPPLRGPPV